MEHELMIEDCFLRPINENVHSTNTSNTTPASNVPLKTELQVIRLDEVSQKLTMETLQQIHGPDFHLDDSSKYKDPGGRIKKTYWEERGNLVVQSVTNYAAASVNNADEQSVDRLRRYALLKLENYGFPMVHCVEAYDHCDGDTESALRLLFKKYMRVPEMSAMSFPVISTTAELLDVRSDERAALEAIYDNAFSEKDHQTLWSLKFEIDHLLAHSPSEVRKAREAIEAAAATKKVTNREKKAPARCRYFDRNGTCKFGNKCRFAHLPPSEVEIVDGCKSKNNADDGENEKWFYLEIRFPPETKYPYEAPYIYLKTTCHDIPRDILLRITRRLYREACEIAQDGMPCVYSISELLQRNESLFESMHVDTETFPSVDKSLFAIDEEEIDGCDDKEKLPLPSHYVRGQTSNSARLQRSTSQLETENRLLLRRFLERQKDKRYRNMMSMRQKLPAFAKMMEILETIESSNVVVISGETGCGKSTQVPQFILDNWFFQCSKLDTKEKLPHVEIVCTQPRRLSAIGVAERVADERADTIGQIVGYQIRLENKISTQTRLTFCTTGILLRRLASDPLLESLTHIIVDEVHERSEESDFLLMILKNILRRRNNLKVILMSATLNAQLFSNYFGGVPVLNIPGRTFPVTSLFLEDILEECDYVIECDSQYSRKIQKKEEEELMRELSLANVEMQMELPPASAKDENLNLAAIFARYKEYSKKTCKTIYLMEQMKTNPELIESVMKHIVDGNHDWPRVGSILIFLPGMQEIQSVYDALCDSSTFSPRAGNFLLIPLHSSLSSEEQTAIFRPAPKGVRKIILSTNIAETSVTIDDCVFVIDCGLMKEESFDANRNMGSLNLVWVSRANAMQRRGRAGRVMSGVCIHLYTGHRFHHNILAQPVPEIQRVPLEQLLLRIKTLQNFAQHNILEVLGETIEPPTEESIMAAVKRLQDVGALDEKQRLTALGHHLAALPVDVHIGKLMLFGAIFQCLDSVLTIAACLSNKSPFVSPFNKRTEADKCKRSFAIYNSDHLTCLMAYKKWLEVSRRSFMAARNFANENFLSLRTLQTISEIKYQFLELLVSIGFVPVDVPRKRKNANDNILNITGESMNVNGENYRLLSSLLCFALYPNIAKVMTPERSYIQTAAGALPKIYTSKDLRFKTHEDGYVAIHPSSVLWDLANFQSPFLVYHEKVKTSKIFLRECSILQLVPFVLFAGGVIKIELHDTDFLILLEDGWIILKAYNYETAEMLLCLRKELIKLLEEKIRDPCLNLLHHENGCKIITTIVHLVTKNA